MARKLTIAGAPVLWRLGAGHPPGGAHVALIPGEEAPLLPLELPDRLRGAARERVAERQLAEALSLPPAGFEMQPFQPKGVKVWRRAVVAEAETAAAWRLMLARSCQGAVPDYLALPAAEGLWTLRVEETRVLARLGVEDGFAAEPDLALALLQAAPAPRAVLRLGAAPEEALAGFLDGLDVPVLTEAAALRKAGFRPLRWSDAVDGIDLKTPPRAVQDRVRAGLRRWRMAGLAAMLAAAAYGGALWIETRRLDAAAARDSARIQDLVRAHFVPAGPILDIRAQVAAGMAQVRAPAAPEAPPLTPLEQLKLAAGYLSRDALVLQSVAYRSDTGLVATIEAVDFAALGVVREDLTAAGFTVEELDSRAQQSGGVVARLRLELTS